jgi:hypothetical protein
VEFEELLKLDDNHRGAWDGLGWCSESKEIMTKPLLPGKNTADFRVQARKNRGADPSLSVGGACGAIVATDQTSKRRSAAHCKTSPAFSCAFRASLWLNLQQDECQTFTIRASSRANPVGGPMLA